MLVRNSIQKKLFLLFIAVFISSITLITIINTVIARSVIIDRLTEHEIPAQVQNIIADIKKELLLPATGLKSIAEDPFFREWIDQGEPESDLPKVIERLRTTTEQFSTKGSNFVSWNSKKYYNFADDKYSPRMVTEKDSWFGAFGESGDDLGINVYTNHDLYGTVAFMNQRIDKDGSYLGIMSCALSLQDLVDRVVNHKIGENGTTFLTDKSGKITVHTDQKLLEDNATLRDLKGFSESAVKEVLAGDRYQFSYRQGTTRMLVQTQYIPEIKWYLVTVADSGELTSGLVAAVWISIVLLILFITVGSLLLLYRLKPIIQALKDTVDAANDIALGNLGVELSTDRVDEIGVLVNAMNKMIESLKVKAAVFRHIADGDLTVEVPLASDMDDEGKALQEMKRSLSEIIGNVNQAVVEVNSGADQISLLSQGLSTGASEQAASLEEISSSIQEISYQAEKSSNAAKEAETLASSTVDKADKGSESMANLNSLMGRIHESSDKIMKVIKLIDDIAFQINLLALNAAVEAARAGQHGKGFAVVADEVRNLATRSAKAVEETSQNVTETVEAIGEGVSLAEFTSEQFHAILTEVGAVARNLSQITELEEQQSGALHQITEGLSQIDSVIQNTAASAEEGAAAAEELASQTHVLRHLVDHFTIEEHGQKRGDSLPTSRQLGNY